MKYDGSNLKEVLAAHEKWLNHEDGGERADLQGADLQGVNLQHACLQWANKQRANMRDANLKGTDMQWADLREATLRWCNMQGALLQGACLRGADLKDACLQGADMRRTLMEFVDMRAALLREVDMQGADLRGADLRGVDLRGAKNVPLIPMTCPDAGAFIGWKKCRGNRIVKLLIPEDARRSSSTGRKCRCDKATVLAIETLRGAAASTNTAKSNRDKTFLYKIGETVTVDNFDEDRFNECASGIHFFINRQEAVEYNL